ncbi:hypothetical protein, partial [Oceanitalea stevensii]|uniref:hypothetical protein n=1 Tax=Oceanitalea stevensii TaxID=2763072 RepID=UPI002044DE37
MALVITALLYVWLYRLAQDGQSNTVLVMPFMDNPDAHRWYWLSQAFGWTALLWAWGTLLLGLNRPGFRRGSVTWNQPRSGQVFQGSA